MLSTTSMEKIRKLHHQSSSTKSSKSHWVRTNQHCFCTSTSEVKDSWWPTCTRSSSMIWKRSLKQLFWLSLPETSNQDGLKRTELNKDQTQELWPTFIKSTWTSSCCPEALFPQEPELDLTDHQSLRLFLIRPINISLKKELLPLELLTKN